MESTFRLRGLCGFSAASAFQRQRLEAAHEGRHDEQDEPRPDEPERLDAEADVYGADVDEDPEAADDHRDEPGRGRRGCQSQLVTSTVFFI
jgi:hypothetical protein